MNREAERHLAAARKYLGRGEEFYRKAAAEMKAAKDAGATWPEIGDRLGRSKSWCEKIVAWAESPANGASAPTPFAEPHRENPDVRGAKRVLGEAPLEQVERIVAELPPERKQAIAAAAGDAYAKAREEYEQKQRDLTPAQRAEREAAAEAVTKPVRQAAAGFATLGIAAHIEQATEELNELVGRDELTPAAWEPVEKALAALNEEATVARAMLGLSEEVQA